MKTLIIDNNIEPHCWGSKDISRYVRKISQSMICVRRAPQEDLPTNPAVFNRVIVSGSLTSALEDAPWIDQLMTFIQKTIDLNIPFLGICYGHQILARTLGGSKSFVRKATTAEFGWTQIQIVEPSPLLEGLPSTFYTFSAHFDEVVELPRGMKRLAYSSACGIQACQLESRPIYGIQFHPERTLEEAEKTFIERKKIGTPRSLLHPTRSKELYNPKIGETLFKNFLQTQTISL